MFRFVVLLAVATVVSAHRVPAGYHFITYHPAKQEHKAESWAEKPKNDWEEKSWEAKQWDHKSWEPKEEWNHKSWEPKSESWEKKEDETPKNYDFKYEVHDEKTGDIKRQSETASHGVVKGQYSLIDSDGFRRVVEYTADDVHGFQATVKREPTHFKVPQPEKKVEEPKHVHWW